MVNVVFMVGFINVLQEVVLVVVMAMIFVNGFVFVVIVKLFMVVLVD
jgi:hypothetical protein